eukprot:PhF_6_TR12478/c0_g1_i2/m.19616
MSWLLTLVFLIQFSLNRANFECSLRQMVYPSNSDSYTKLWFLQDESFNFNAIYSSIYTTKGIDGIVVRVLGIVPSATVWISGDIKNLSQRFNMTGNNTASFMLRAFTNTNMTEISDMYYLIRNVSISINNPKTRSVFTVAWNLLLPL